MPALANRSFASGTRRATGRADDLATDVARRSGKRLHGVSYSRMVFGRWGQLLRKPGEMRVASGLCEVVFRPQVVVARV